MEFVIRFQRDVGLQFQKPVHNAAQMGWRFVFRELHGANRFVLTIAFGVIHDGIPIGHTRPRKGPSPLSLRRNAA